MVSVFAIVILSTIGALFQVCCVALRCVALVSSVSVGAWSPLGLPVDIYAYAYNMWMKNRSRGAVSEGKE